MKSFLSPSQTVPNVFKAARPGPAPAGDSAAAAGGAVVRGSAVPFPAVMADAGGRQGWGKGFLYELARGADLGAPSV